MEITNGFFGQFGGAFVPPPLESVLKEVKIYFKREDLNHTGAHKINNAIATVCALFGMDCTIYMGEVDIKRQELNGFRMNLLGAKVVSVTTGTSTLKDAVDAALNDFVINAEDTFYLLGSAVGPDPYPTMVREFQSIIGIEARRQILEAERRLPDYLVACVGGGSNAIGLFHPFYNDEEVPVYSSAAGLDYPGVGPEHCYYHDIGRAEYVSVTDTEALAAFMELSKLEGIIPALESAHAVAYAIKLAATLPKDKIMIVNLSGGRDKDVAQVKEMLEG